MRYIDVKKIFAHRIARNAGAVTIIQLVNYVTPLLVLVHLTKVLGVELYGVVAFSMGILQLSLTLMDFGFSLSATQKISLWRDRKRYVGRLIGAVFVIKFALFLLVSAIVITYAFCTDKYSAYYLVFVLSLLPVFGQTFQPVWFFSGIERIRFVTIFMVTAKLLYVGFIFLFVSDGSDYLLVPLSNGAAQILAMLLGVLLIYHVGYYIEVPRIRDVRYAFQITAGFFVSCLSVTAYMNSGIVLLGLFATPATVAAYSMAEQIYKAMQAVFMPISQAVYPYMVKERNVALIVRLTVGCVCLAVLGAILGYALFPLLVPMIFGAGWGAAVRVLHVFLVAIIVHVAASMSGYPLAAALGRLHVAKRSAVFGSLVYMVCAVALVVAGQGNAVAFAVLMVVAELYVLLHRALVLWPQAFKLRKLSVA
ncbi:MAG: hypothetical protein AUK28_03210 [Desulfobacterales bacterium CG2_30_60_27]|nr:MAG: hypothetical protein AUK28_03210 [Desulfobacterales bacterium CG2_30_60_27]